MAEEQLPTQAELDREERMIRIENEDKRQDAQEECLGMHWLVCYYIHLPLY